jgi:hypothetical protein
MKPLSSSNETGVDGSTSLPGARAIAVVESGIELVIKPLGLSSTCSIVLRFERLVPGGPPVHRRPIASTSKAGRKIVGLSMLQSPDGIGGVRLAGREKCSTGSDSEVEPVVIPDAALHRDDKPHGLGRRRGSRHR